MIGQSEPRPGETEKLVAITDGLRHRLIDALQPYVDMNHHDDPPCAADAAHTEHVVDLVLPLVEAAITADRAESAERIREKTLAISKEVAEKDRELLERLGQ